VRNGAGKDRDLESVRGLTPVQSQPPIPSPSSVPPPANGSSDPKKRCGCTSGQRKDNSSTTGSRAPSV
jgi:hypothetical protein